MRARPSCAVAEAGGRAACRELPRAYPHGGCYFPMSQSCLEAFINEAQSSGGPPCASILAKIVYGSVLLPDERSVDRSLTQA